VRRRDEKGLSQGGGQGCWSCLKTTAQERNRKVYDYRFERLVDLESGPSKIRRKSKMVNNRTASTGSLNNTELDLYRRGKDQVVRLAKETRFVLHQ